MSPAQDDAIWLLRVATERMRQRKKWGALQVLPRGPASSTALASVSHALEEECREECDAGRATWAAVIVEEVLETLREEFGTVAFERECVQVAAVAVQMAQASAAARADAHACAWLREEAPTGTGSDDA